ncbi:MAG: hypothetical protein ACK4ZJ_17135, partial [Allorhizobium sp.]
FARGAAGVAATVAAGASAGAAASKAHTCVTAHRQRRTSSVDSATNSQSMATWSPAPGSTLGDNGTKL